MVGTPAHYTVFLSRSGYTALYAVTSGDPNRMYDNWPIPLEPKIRWDRQKKDGGRENKGGGQQSAPILGLRVPSRSPSQRQKAYDDPPCQHHENETRATGPWFGNYLSRKTDPTKALPQTKRRQDPQMKQYFAALQEQVL